MRNFLTFIAVALVTALTVALVAPPLIDWSARREMVARAISERIGTPVVISGPITVRMLPIPYLDLADVAIGPRGAPWLSGPKMRFEFGLFSLFSGKIRLDDVTFERPTLRIGPHFSTPAETPLEFARIRARHAEVQIARAGASPIVLADLNFDGAAASTRGPFHGGGDFAATNDARANFQVASEAFQAEQLPVRAEIESGSSRAEFDGWIAVGATPSFEGKATLLGEAPAPDGGVWPVRVEGSLSARGDQAKMQDAAVHLGNDARALEADGGLTLAFGAKPALEADLKAKTLNFDSFLRKDKEAFAPPSRIAETFAGLGAEALRRGGPVKTFFLKLESRVAYLGARPIEALKIALSGSPSEAMRLALEAGLPGQGRLKLDGSLELKPAAVFHGHAEGAVGEYAPLAAWLAEDEPDWAGRFASLQAALPNGPIAAAGDVDLSSEGFAGRGLKLKVGTSTLEGEAVYRFAQTNARGRLFLDLASDALDIDVAPNVEAGLDWLGDNDLDFSLAAKSLRVARVGLASVESGSLAIRALKEGAKFSLQRLSLSDLGGASIEAEGETSPAGRWTRIKLDAGRLEAFATLLARAAPSPLTRWLQQRASDLGAAKATIEARRDGPPFAGGFPLDFLKADGEVAASRFGVVLSRAPAPVDAISADVKLDSPDAGALLRRLGVKAPVGPPGRAQLSLSGSGKIDETFSAKAKLALAGTEIDWRGDIRPGAEGDAAVLDGPLTLKSADLLQALSAFGLATSGIGVTSPAEVSAGLTARANGARLSNIAGTLAGSRISGDLAFAAPAREQASLEQLVAMANADSEAAQKTAPPVITGALEFDRASASGLLTALLGRAGPVRPGEFWSQSKFAPALLAPPLTQIALKVGAFDYGFGVARTLAARLEMNPDRLALQDASFSLNGGGAEGKISLRRDKATATASGSLAFTDVVVDRPALHAKLDGNVDFAGSGDTATALVGGLAATGHVSVAEAKIPRLDPDALSRAMAKIERANSAPLDETRLAAAIGAELDHAPLTIADATSPLASGSGALRFGPFDAAAHDGTAKVSGSLGLANLAFGLDATLTDPKTGPFWSGPPPTLEVTTKGTLDAVSRKIDTSLLFAGLAAEAVAREADRIANFEADVRERAAFNRVLKADRFLTRRAAEIAAFDEERERQRLMDEYLPAYSAWAASRRDNGPAPSAKLENGTNRPGG